MSGKGALGWLILAVALAVPAFMFWNWWKLLNNKPAEAGRHSSEPGPVFGTTQMAQNMPNPLSNSTSTAAGPAGGNPTSIAVAVSTASGAEALSTASGRPSQTPATSGTAFAASAPASATPAAPQAGVTSGATPQMAAANASSATAAAVAAPQGRVDEQSLRYQPKVHRDPMMSPMDIKRLAQIELEKEDERRRLEEEERKKHEKKVVVKPKARPIETTITLYGITAAPGSITAMVEVEGFDTQIVRPGDKLANGVRISKITQTTVTFQHKTKTWSRSLNK